MNTIEAIILGIVQGFAEFLPISSSAHLVIAQSLMGLPTEDLIFDLVVHLATVLSVLTLFGKLIGQIAKETVLFPITRKQTVYSRAGLMVIIASIPTAIIGFAFKKEFEAMFSSLRYVGIFMLVTGVILFLTKKIAQREVTVHRPGGYDTAIQDMGKLNVKQALIVGFAQGCAIAPGISRSGSTIATGMFVGIPRQLASVFSFLLSIPAILGAALLKFREANWAEANWTSLSAGFLAAYICGVLGLLLVLKTTKKGRLDVFSYYMWIIGGLVLLRSFYM